MPKPWILLKDGGRIVMLSGEINLIDARQLRTPHDWARLMEWIITTITDADEMAAVINRLAEALKECEIK